MSQPGGCPHPGFGKVLGHHCSSMSTPASTHRSPRKGSRGGGAGEGNWELHSLFPVSRANSCNSFGLFWLEEGRVDIFLWFNYPHFSSCKKCSAVLIWRGKRLEMLRPL